MSKHTPGPWFAVGAQVETENDSVPDICTCDPQVMRQSHLDWHPRTVEANARLIAAAPDLLATLKAAVSLLENLGYFSDNSLTVAAAREAIANAK
jgi:hypothetical protein